jgi:alpha-tubulin suppressor-like RCC1 family protein
MSNCTVYCYGENDKCILGLPEARKYEVTPLLTQPDTGTSFLFGIQDDAEQEEQTSFFAPFQIASISTASYPTHTLFLTNYGVCYGAGSNSSNRLALGAGDAFIVSEPTRIRFFTDLNLRVTKCFAFEYGSVWCTDDGSIYFAGRVSQYGTFVNIDIGPVVITKNHPKFSHFAATYYSIVLLGGLWQASQLTHR